ncbi:MAG: energy transducer TonB [Candidatus Polarisedimenticolia bacterium]
MRATLLGLAAAVLIHAAVILFGGLLFPKPEATKPGAKVENVDLLTEADEKKPEEEEKKTEPSEDAAEEAMEVVPERPPDARELELLHEKAAAAAVPELAALSLGALESALGGAAGDGGFGGVLNLASGGRIGGTGAPGVQAEGPAADTIFALPDLDQKPRPIFQAEPIYPFELRQRKVEGTVYVLFVVDKEGKVIDPKVETSTHGAFDKPALDAVRQWRFEPAVRGGQRVQARLRVPIRFQKG